MAANKDEKITPEAIEAANALRDHYHANRTDGRTDEVTLSDVILRACNTVRLGSAVVAR